MIKSGIERKIGKMGSGVYFGVLFDIYTHTEHIIEQPQNY